MDPEEDGYDITDSYVPRWVGAKPVSYLAENGSSGAAVLLSIEDHNWTLPLEDALRVLRTFYLACTIAKYASMVGEEAASGSPDEMIGRVEDV